MGLWNDGFVSVAGSAEKIITDGRGTIWQTFFEQLGKKISDVAEDFGKKTEDTLEVQRIKSQIRSLDRANERDYIEIGKKIYQKFKAGEVADLECISLCESIEKREEEAAQCQEEIRKNSGGITDVIDGSRRTSCCAGVRGHEH